jgi:DNA-binding YbaB/EbfC family protein
MAPNPQQMLKQVQKMQADMGRAQEELANEFVEASAGGGAVKVSMSGALQVNRVVIDPKAVDPDDVDMLQDMVEAAVNEALRMAQELASAKMARITGGMNIPGLF